MVPIAQLRAWLNAEESGAQDDLLRQVESQVVDLLGRYCNRYFGPPQEVTITVRRCSNGRIFLPDPPVGAVAIQSRSGVGESWASYSGVTEVDGSVLYFAEWSDGVAVAGWPSQFRLTYTRGYTEVTAPPALVAIVLDFCRYYYKEGRVLPATMGLYQDRWPIPGAQVALSAFYRPVMAP